jgi:DNA-binding LytR/AlgR family response regulator
MTDELNRKLREHKQDQEKVVHFVSDYQKDSLSLKANHILVIRSANNYIEVFWREDEAVRNQMIRCSMTNAEEAIKEYKFIYKCHRSYLVNVNYIERFEGNSQGYKIIFENLGFPVPVSRSSAAKLRELI